MRRVGRCSTSRDLVLAPDEAFIYKETQGLNIDLNGKTAIITGSTAGIGYAIVLGLASCGARVVINGRKDASVKAALAKLKSAHPDAKVEGVAADLSTAAGCAALVSAHG